jgi:hypothetical protein
MATLVCSVVHTKEKKISTPAVVVTLYSSVNDP